MSEEPTKTAATTGEPDADDAAQRRTQIGSTAENRPGHNPGLGDQPASGTTIEAAAQEDVDELRAKTISLEFEISKSIRYHGKRCAFFETLNHGTRAVAAIFAAGAIISIVGQVSWLAASANVLVAFMLSLDLVFDFARRARIHDDLRQDFTNLLAEMVAHPINTDEEYRRSSADRVKIEGREPSPIEVLNVVCVNEELEGRGYDYRYQVTPLQYFFRNFFSIHPGEFPRVPKP